MSRKVIIAAAITSSIHAPTMSPYFPITLRRSRPLNVFDVTHQKSQGMNKHVALEAI